MGKGKLCKLCDWVVRLMYWLLNYIPIFLQIMLFGVVLNTRISFNISIGIYGVINLFVFPLYLLVVNTIGINKGRLTFVKSIGRMFSAVILNTVVILVTHKIQTGYYIGDVPEGIYYLLIGIPTVIIVIGMGIVYFIRKL